MREGGGGGVLHVLEREGAGELEDEGGKAEEMPNPGPTHNIKQGDYITATYGRLWSSRYNNAHFASPDLNTRVELAEWVAISPHPSRSFSEQYSTYNTLYIMGARQMVLLAAQELALTPMVPIADNPLCMNRVEKITTPINVNNNDIRHTLILLRRA